ncbi:Insulin-like domain-containing protein [Strongyloides ratti]|uniref:Insulin-like domain-containing protein n=1 Tax=Strongyloides ratti TaxID=34506 RepID=A0A090LNR4_STRRB|nr:Insulin-like domain-containing protein [Strongyloides ratti]CEF71401.1 Insulin-like domain-containing protein [Strongyloides ratti]
MNRGRTVFQLTTLSSILIIFIFSFYYAEGRYRNIGQIKMCPPGGESFAVAWQLSCNLMKKRSQQTDKDIYGKIYNDNQKKNSTHKRYMQRALSLNELMKYCCLYGCTPKDLNSYCF